MKIAILSPHRADAALSLGLSISAWIAAGHKVAVINACTRSDHAPFSDAGSLHPNDRMSFVTALRHREDEAWRRRVGNALSFVDLNLKDAPLRLRCSLQEAALVEVNPNDKIIPKVQKAIEALHPAALVLPLALDPDVDHRAVLAAAEKLAATLPCAFYEELPAALQAANIEQHAAALAHRLDTTLSPNVSGSAADATQQKLRIALTYDSQFNDATAQQIADFTQRYNHSERLWANQAWQQTTLTTPSAPTTH